MKTCPAGAVLLAAVSGGADSTAMLAALVSLRDKAPEAAPAAIRPTIDLRCVHVEHGIRPPNESGGDADFVRELCAGFRVPCRVETIPPGKIAKTAKTSRLGIEAAARLFRCRALLREARRLETESGRRVFILTAHTAGDALETALMRFLRGAGPAGLAAMPTIRGRFLRPLLALSRPDVLRYLAEKKIPWREDSTNADTRFLRNRVRHCLVPLLDESFPQWRRGLAETAKTQALAAAFIDAEARGRIRWDADPRAGLSTGAEIFFAQSPIIREQALFQACDRLLASRGRSGGKIRRVALRRFCEGGVKAVDLGPARVSRDNERILLSLKKSGAVERGFSLLIKEPGLYTLKRVSIEARPCVDCRENAKAEDSFFALFPLVLRPAFKGDWLVSKGRKIAPPDLVKGPEPERLWALVDRLGTAAFIGSRGLLAGRDDPGAEARIKVTIQFTKGRE